VLLQAVLPFERLVAHLAPVVDRRQMVAFVYEQRIVFVERPVAVFAHKLHFDPLGPESVVFRVELYYRVHGRAAAAFSPGAPRADYDNNIIYYRTGNGGDSGRVRVGRLSSATGREVNPGGKYTHDCCNSVYDAYIVIFRSVRSCDIIHVHRSTVQAARISYISDGYG